MNTVILRWFNGDDKIEQQIVGCAVEGEDIFITFQNYLKSNRIEFTDNLPYKTGMFCVRDGEQYTVFDIRTVPDWDMDDKAPLYNTYVCSLKFLKFSIKEDSKEREKEALAVLLAMPASEPVAPIIQ